MECWKYLIFVAHEFKSGFFFWSFKKILKRIYQEVEKNPGDWHSIYNFIVDVDERIYMG